jgi:hypothetical protein
LPTKNIDISIISAQLEELMLWAVPAIEHFLNDIITIV